MPERVTVSLAWRPFLLLSTQTRKGRQMKRKMYNNCLSRRETPWDDKLFLTESESFIKNRYEKQYYSRHPVLIETGEDKIINSFKASFCPHCASENFKMKGFTRNGIQRYYCNDCNRTFTILTGTIFQDHKISISEWIEYLLDMFNYSSITLASKVNKNAFTTSKYWLSKIFLLLNAYQDNIILKGDVLIDETYYTNVKRNITTKDGKKLRGISKNQYCIATAKDAQYIYMKFSGMGKPSMNKTIKAYKDHIEKGSHLIHDDENSHQILIDELKLTDECFASSYLKTLKDEENPLYPLNRIHFLLKNFLGQHSGFNRSELQGYLDLFTFIMNPPHDNLEKVKILIELALNTKKRLKYREYYAKKD